MFQKSYAILRNNMLFIQPILVWQLIFTAVLFFCMNRNQMFIPRMILWISVLLLFIACLSGWLYINKYAVLSYNPKDSEEEVTEKTLQNFKKFFEGIGSDFFRTCLMCLISALIYFAVLYGIYKFCVINYGIPDFFSKLAEIAQNGTKENIMQYLNSVSDTDKLLFSKWVLTVNTGISIINFFVLLYFTVMSFERKNFIVSFFITLKFLILNLFESI